MWKVDKCVPQTLCHIDGKPGRNFIIRLGLGCVSDPQVRPRGNGGISSDSVKLVHHHCLHMSYLQ